MMRFILLVVVAATLSSCRTERQADPEAARRVIDSLNTRIEGWYVAKQPDSVAGVFAEDAWIFPPNAPAAFGRDSIRAFWTNFFKLGSVVFDLKTQEVIVADSIVVERGQYVLDFTPLPNGPLPAFQDRGNYITVWRQEGDGHWRILWDAPSSTVPLPKP